MTRTLEDLNRLAREACDEEEFDQYPTFEEGEFPSNSAIWTEPDDAVVKEVLYLIHINSIDIPVLEIENDGSTDSADGAD